MYPGILVEYVQAGCTQHDAIVFEYVKRHLLSSSADGRTQVLDTNFKPAPIDSQRTQKNTNSNTDAL